MTETTQNIDTKAAALLLETVAVPAFAEKLAADYGITADGQEMANLQTLSDHLAATIEPWLQKRASAVTASRTSAIKAAVDTAFEIGGTKAPAKVVPVDTVKVATPYLELAGVKEAADAILAQRVEAAKAAVEKKAEESCGAMPAEEDEDKEKGEPAAVAAA